MISAVLAMYSTPEHPMYRNLGDGVICQEALKIAGSRASKHTELGWAVIRAAAGDNASGKVIIKELAAKGFKSNEILGAFMAVLPDNLCVSCNGTGTKYSKTGKRWLECDRCKGSGRRKINLEGIQKKTGATKARLEAAIDVCLKAKAEAEKIIIMFLRNEKSELA